MDTFHLMQPVSYGLDDLDAETVGLDAWLYQIERQALRAVADPEISIIEPASYIDETGKQVWAAPLVDQDGNELLDKNGEQIPPPRLVRVVGEVRYAG